MRNILNFLTGEWKPLRNRLIVVQLGFWQRIAEGNQFASPWPIRGALGPLSAQQHGRWQVGNIITVKQRPGISGDMQQVERHIADPSVGNDQQMFRASGKSPSIGKNGIEIRYSVTPQIAWKVAERLVNSLLLLRSKLVELKSDRIACAPHDPDLIF